jgi:hypothetical protein
VFGDTRAALARCGLIPSDTSWNKQD